MNERVLVIAAHPDDEVLGCGGTMARHVIEGDDVHVLFVADGETARIQAAKPNRNLAAAAACKKLGTQPPQFLDLKDQKLDHLYSLLEITQAIEAHISDIRPTVVYTHHAGDLNKDHRIVHQAAMTACRPLSGSSVRSIFSFEVLSTTELGGGFWPNHFVNISGRFMDQKIQALEYYDAEMRSFPHPRSYQAIQSQAILRGVTVGLPAAEAFMVMRSLYR